MRRNGESTNYSQRSNVKKQLTIVVLSLVQITKKANCTLGFLHWNLRHCPTACKQNTYLALIHRWNTEPSSWTHTKAVTRWSKFSKAQHASKPGTIAQLFHRLKIRRFSGSLAELFLAPPHSCTLSVESRSVPAVVSTRQLLLIFNLWAAECTWCFLYFK